jgi:hypothetical protein
MAGLRKTKQYMDALDSSATPTSPMPHVSMKDATMRVWNAMNNSEYDWRTIAGIAKETGLSASAVSNILERELGNQVVRATDKNHPGEYLYATRDRYNKIRGPWNRVLSVITSQVK